MSFCEACESEPCVWMEHQVCVLAAVEQFKDLQVSKGKACPNNICRKYCYRQISLLIQGPLGNGHRMKLPSCVEDGVRSQYPNENGDSYMGFKVAPESNQQPEDA